MIFDINKVIIVDLDGNPMGIPSLGKELGNLIYRSFSTIEWLEHCQKIHKNLPVELSDLELAELSSTIVSPSCSFILAVKDALITYIKELHD